jgi:hypothetical protein
VFYGTVSNGNQKTFVNTKYFSFCLLFFLQGFPNHAGRQGRVAVRPGDAEIYWLEGDEP